MTTISAGDGLSKTWALNTFGRSVITFLLLKSLTSINALPAYAGLVNVNSLPETLTLDTWNTSLTTYSYTNQIITLTYNLTKAVQNLFKNKTEFLNNWASLPNNNSDIDNYIISTILTYYNISFSKIKLNIYSKNGTNIINYTYDDSMEEISQNFGAELSIINGDYIYKIKINNVYNNYLAYYVKFTLFEL